MSKPGIFTEIRFDTADIQGVFRAVPSIGYDFRISFDGDTKTIQFSPADLACAADFFSMLARRAAESSKETA
jgi:hypothetical protein